MAKATTDKSNMEALFKKGGLGFVTTKHSIQLCGGMKNVEVFEFKDRAVTFEFDDEENLVGATLVD